MKARVKDNAIILSIGMIVKNEEKDLEACLESLRPLMDEVESELIIVDTGSTDRTVEIAQKYTDQIYDFEWINDFAAARNFGVDKAKGKWFFQVDADDRLQDPAELIEFLNDEKELKKYYTANIVYHSYTNKEYTMFSDARIVRLFRLGVGNRFRGSIHEVPARIIPTKELQTVIDHYGYVYETPEDAQRKAKRNNILLEKELEEKPDDIRLLDHYAATCEPEKKREVLEHARELCKKEPEHFYFSNIYWKLTRLLYILKEYEEVIKATEEYFSLTTQPHVGDIEIRFNAGNSLYQMGEHKRAVDEFRKYIDLYSQYKDGSLQAQDTMCAVAERVSDQNRETTLCQMVNCYQHIKEYAEIPETIYKIPISHISPNLPAYFQKVLQEAIRETKDYNILFRVEKWYNEIPSDAPSREDKIKSMRVFLAGCCLEVFDGEDWENLVNLAQGEESLLAKAVLAASESTPSTVYNQILEDYGSLLLAAGMRYQREMLPLLYKLGRDCFTRASSHIAEKAPDIVDVVMEYQPLKDEEQDLLWRGWMVEMDSRVFQKAEGEDRLPVLKRLMKDFSWYVNHLYNAGLLCPEKLAVLPSAHRFGYWAGLALDAEKAGNPKDYIHYLREASQSCPKMAGAVKLLLNEFEEKDEEHRRQKEQQELSRKIKEIIEGMILNGRWRTQRRFLPNMS